MQLPAFFFDIDGTLIDYLHGMTKISDGTVQALDKLREKHPCFIASGRTKCFINDRILEYPFDGFVTCNGAYVEYQNTCVYKKAIAIEDLEALIQVCDELDCVAYLEDHDHMYVYNSHLACHTWFKNKWEMKDEIIVTDFDIHHLEVYIAMILAKDEKPCDEIVKRLSPHFDVSRHVNQNSFDLNNRGEDKAKGIEEVMKFFHSDLSDAWAFGDANNDFGMIQAVGHGIAMGNAVEDLKKIAFDVTDDCVDDGIVSALKKYNFI